MTFWESFLIHSLMMVPMITVYATCSVCRLTQHAFLIFNVNCFKTVHFRIFNHRLISGGIRVRIPQELNVMAFWSWNLDVVVSKSWNLDVVAFCRLKKCLGIMMSWVNCLRFSMSRFFGLGISMSWLFGLGISMSWYMCLHGLVFVFTKSIMPHN